MRINIGTEEWLGFKKDAVLLLGALQTTDRVRHRIINLYFDSIIADVLPQYGQEVCGEVAALINSRREELLSENVHSDEIVGFASLKERYCESKNDFYDIVRFIGLCEEVAGGESVMLEFDGSFVEAKRSTRFQEESASSLRDSDRFRAVFLSIVLTYDFSRDKKHDVLQKWLDTVVLPAYSSGQITMKERDDIVGLCEELDEDNALGASELNCTYNELMKEFQYLRTNGGIFNIQGLIECFYDVVPVLEQAYKFVYGDLVSTSKILPGIRVVGLISGTVDSAFTNKKVYVIRPLHFVGISECYTVEEGDLEPMEAITMPNGDSSSEGVKPF